MAKRRFGLQAQFVGLIIGLLSLVFIVITFSVVRQATNNYKNRLQTQAKAYASLATEPIGNSYVLYKDSGRVKIQQQVDKLTELDNSVANVIIVSVNGDVLFEQVADSPFTATSQEAESFEILYSYDKEGYLSKVVVPFIEDFGGHRYSVAYQISSDTFKSSARQLTVNILVFSTIMLILTAAVIYLTVNRWFLNPIRKISSTAMIISKGNWDKKIALERNDELRDMAESVNTMAGALLEDIKKLKAIDVAKTEFMMIASHNLRTPLTILGGYLEILKQAKLDDKTAQLVTPMFASTQRLSAFAEDMLIVSRIESGDKQVLDEKKQTDINELFSRITEEFEPLCKEKQIEFASQIPAEQITANISRSYIRNAVWNLLDNAIKFTQDGGKIDLSVRTEAGKLKIDVSDTGIGISEEEKSKIFTKFHRGTSTFKYDYEGTGIGLYVTKLIIEEHGGNISFISAEGQGSKFSIELPLN